MPLPRHLFTPVFRSMHLGRSFAAIVSIMVFIATFATAAETALLTMGYVWGQAADSRITVEIPAVDDETSVPQAERVKQTIMALRGVDGIGLVMPLSEEDVAHLLAPWFSQPELLKSLPMPTLIDVERKAGENLSMDQIQAVVKNVVSDARVDDHGAWTRDIWRLIRGLSLLGGLTIALTGVTLVIGVSLICRAVMAAEHETISLLHLLGTDDVDIAKHFQMQSERISLRAASFGFIGALIVTAGLLYAVRDIVDVSTLQTNHWIYMGIAVFSIPIAAIAIASATARFSVMRLIESFP